MNRQEWRSKVKDPTIRHRCSQKLKGRPKQGGSGCFRWEVRDGIQERQAGKQHLQRWRQDLETGIDPIDSNL